jgi:glucokinase
MDFRQDSRYVLTLDAGGTNFVFGAMRGGEPAVEPRTLPSGAHDLDLCLATLVEGFRSVLADLPGPASAISFAFPGPADYPAGIIGDLGNLPCFRGGIAVGPMLEDRFGLPVFINNDGDLFAYGEAIGGLLPEINAALAQAGSPKRFRNLLGVTLGTGFGAGLVADGRLYLGDNAAGAEIWCVRNKLEPSRIAEDGASIRAVRGAYAALAGLAPESVPEPRDICAIALGEIQGDRSAALGAFRRLGEVVGDALAGAVTLVDSLVVVGGGLSGAAPLFLPALVEELNAPLGPLAGSQRLEVTAFNLEDAGARARFLQGGTRRIIVPGSGRTLDYDPLKRTGIGISRLGTSRAVALGAYAYALAMLGGAGSPGR